MLLCPAERNISVILNLCLTAQAMRFAERSWILSFSLGLLLRIADQIVVFNNGKIEAIGSHEELLKKSVTYHNLYMNETQNCHILK